MGFADYVWADVIGVIVALAIYDWAVDPILDLLWKKVRKPVLERQDVS